MILSINQNNNNYDSSIDTLKHRQTVEKYINKLIESCKDRASKHDNSKLYDPEKKIFDEYSPKLSKLKYGSEEYTECLNHMKSALTNHYKMNRHHPEHFDNGISGMTLIDMIEMLCDWLASCERTKNGDIYKSLEINQKRFGFSDDIKQLLINTIDTHFENIKRNDE